MEKRKLGNTDIMACPVGFGGIPIQRLSFGEAERVLARAVERGMNFFDTARGYTDSERKMGQALKPHRDKIYLVSKAMSRDFRGMTLELETSLRNLQTDTIDLYQLHSVGSEKILERITGERGALEALVKAREAGKIRWIGITGHSRPVLLKAVKTGLFDTVQFPFNPIETEWEEEVIPAAKEKGVGIIGMKPVAGGAIKNVSASIRFTLSKGVDVSIPGMDSIDQVDENALAGETPGKITDAEFDKLEEEKKLWEGEFCRRCGYCMPCPEGLNIPFLLLIEAYYSRYDLKDWALSRLKKLEKNYDDCIACGQCLEKCPYDLPIPELLSRASEIVL
ncbi:MAG: aldo/keto reductase [Candidatus Krumholzibacteriota bacterium]|nr:aldo/keto reductase [Candidatus Krumholzibacteriota bacterium]